MGEKLNTLKNNPKQRNIIIFGLGLGILIAAGGAYMATRNKVSAEVTGGASIVGAPNVKTATGSSSSVLYNEKVEKSNKLEADKALEQEKTFVATPVNKNAYSAVSPIDELDKQIKAATQKDSVEIVKEDEIVAPTPAPALVVPMPQELIVAPVVPTQMQQQVVSVPKVERKIVKKKYGSQEDRILIAALSGSNQIKAPNSEFDFAGKGNTESSSSSTAMSANRSDSLNQVSSEQTEGQMLDKAGTIYNAVLETAINSDEPSPVLAKIVSGKLKGTRLIGKMVTSGEKVVVEFKTASIPSFQKSTPISAIAVDPNSSRTGLASDVDNHYFLKYGVLLGAAFLSGYSDALATQNTTTTQNADGSVITTKGAITDKQITEQAFGSVGKELANQTRSQVQTIKPTITVNAGSAIGILLMEDFTAK